MDDCGSHYSELFSSDNFGKKANYDFVFLGTYIGGKYGEWVCINEYFIQEEIAEEWFAKYKVCPLLRVKTLFLQL